MENPPVPAHTLSLYHLIHQSDPYCLYKYGHINSVTMIYFITDINVEWILQEFKNRFVYITSISVVWNEGIP